VPALRWFILSCRESETEELRQELQAMGKQLELQTQETRALQGQLSDVLQILRSK